MKRTDWIKGELVHFFTQAIKGDYFDALKDAEARIKAIVAIDRPTDKELVKEYLKSTLFIKDLAAKYLMTEDEVIDALNNGTNQGHDKISL
jgi:hypothetical protein